MLGIKLDETLTGMDANGLYLLAEFLDKQATICRARAYDLQSYQEMDRRAERMVEFLKDSPKVVMRYLKQGHDIDRAIALAAEHTGIEAVTVKSWWKTFLRDKNRDNVRKRNTLIYDLARIGLTNVAIADRLGLHEVTVCRIIGKEKKNRLYNANPEKIRLYPESRREPAKAAPALSVVK